MVWSSMALIMVLYNSICVSLLTAPFSGLFLRGITWKKCPLGSCLLPLSPMPLPTLSLAGTKTTATKIQQRTVSWSVTHFRNCISLDGWWSLLLPEENFHPLFLLPMSMSREQTNTEFDSKKGDLFFSQQQQTLVLLCKTDSQNALSSMIPIAWANNVCHKSKQWGKQQRQRQAVSTGWSSSPLRQAPRACALLTHHTRHYWFS